jgi:hypothetical protein
MCTLRHSSQPAGCRPRREHALLARVCAAPPAARAEPCQARFAGRRKIEAAREIAGTISQSANRIFLSADSLLLNLVRVAGNSEEDVGNRGAAHMGE